MCDFAVRATHIPCEPNDYTRFAPRLYVTSQAPPTFIYPTSDDQLVAPEGSLRFYEALRRQNIPVEMHIFEHGARGSGLGGSDPSRNVAAAPAGMVPPTAACCQPNSPSLVLSIPS